MFKRKKHVMIFLMVTAVFLSYHVPAGLCAGTAAPSSVGGISVNDTVVPASQLESEYRWILKKKQTFHVVPDERTPQIMAEAVNKVIIWEIVRQKLENRGMTVASEEVDAAMDATRKRWKEKYQSFLEMMGQQEDYLRRRTEAIMNFKRYIEAFLEGKVIISDQEVLDYYQENLDRYRSGKRYKAKSIQIFPAANRFEFDQMEFRKVAAEVRKELLGGKTFEKVAEELVSEGWGAKIRNRTYEAGKYDAYEPALNSLADGELSQPLYLMENSCMIFRLDGIIEALNVSVEDAKPEIISVLTKKKETEIVEAHLKSLRDSTNITYLDEKYKPDED